MKSKSRAEIEEMSRAGASYWYLGGGVGMCRVLGKHKMFVPTRDVSLVPHLIAEGFWESWITQFVVDNVKPGQVAIDVGANVGYYSLLMADLVGRGGRVFAVEANQYLSGLIWHSAAVNGMGQISIYDKAAWFASDVELRFSIPANFLGGACVSAFDPDVPPPENTQIVKTIMIDEIAILNRKLEAAEFVAPRVEPMKVDFVKIDVEGAEEAVLQGMERTITANPDIKILMEFSTNHSNAFFEKVLAGFDVHVITSGGGSRPIVCRPTGEVEMLYMRPRR